jgi:phage-related protein
MTIDRKPVIWVHGELRSPPTSSAARIQAGYLLGLVQEGVSLRMPQSRPMPQIGPRCHELRVRDKSTNWRIIYRIDDQAILVVDIFKKKSATTPKRVIEVCKKRLRAYDPK